MTRPSISEASARAARRRGLLIIDTAQGRERVYRVELRPLVAIEEFIAELRRDQESEWERRFMALETEVHRVKRGSKQRGRVLDQQRDKEKTG